MSLSLSIPDDAQFDERLFESNALLKQYWQNSIGGRSSIAHSSTQRSAQDEDLRVETLKLYDDLVTSTLPQVMEPEVVAEIEAAMVDVMPMIEEPVVPVEMGPILKPLSSGTMPTWGWIVLGVLAGLLLLSVMSYGTYHYFKIPIPNPMRMRGGVKGGVKSYDF